MFVDSSSVYFWKTQHLDSIKDFGSELEKWSIYLQHCAKKGDQKEVREVINKIENLVIKAKGG